MFPCYITRICQYLTATFVQPKILLFAMSQFFQDAQYVSQYPETCQPVDEWIRKWLWKRHWELIREKRYTWYIKTDITSLFPISNFWYFQCHFHFLKCLVYWYNNYKCIIPSISHDKLGFTKTFLACNPFPYYMSNIDQYWSATFVQSKVLLFWCCLYFPDSQYLLVSIMVAHVFLSHLENLGQRCKNLKLLLMPQLLY